jgi:hypothetical protein
MKNFALVSKVEAYVGVEEELHSLLNLALVGNE